jgi:hypothetical protein
MEESGVDTKAQRSKGIEREMRRKNKCNRINVTEEEKQLGSTILGLLLLKEPLKLHESKLKSPM